MTGAEWLVCADPQRMLMTLGTPPCGQTRFAASDRKLRLFVAAVEREWWGDGAGVTEMQSLGRMEGMAESGSRVDVSPGIFFSYSLTHEPFRDALECVRVHNSKGDPPLWANLLRDIFGNPFRYQCLCGQNDVPVLCPGCDHIRLWNDRAIPKMAQVIYDERRFEGMPILADALEEAGCTNEEILQHCRKPQTVECDNGCQQLIRPKSSKDKWMVYEHSGPESRWIVCPKCKGNGKIMLTTHVRGCWVIDLLLGKE